MNVNGKNLQIFLENPNLTAASKVIMLLTLLSETQEVKDKYLADCGLHQVELEQSWVQLKLCDFKPQMNRLRWIFEGENFLEPEAEDVD